jgi:hypothetical protein
LGQFRFKGRWDLAIKERSHFFKASVRSSTHFFANLCSTWSSLRGRR